MKAVEFVKDNPWLLEDGMKDIRGIISDAKEYKFFCLNNILGHSYDNHGGGVAISVEDLKRLVESYELVDGFGGLEEASKTICNAYHGSNHPIPDGHEELSVAIQLVESVENE
ncbi:MAG: hypothetical protein KBT03_00140 [Bacteroidales bacterium]|nr:hypothetical protein [Candidatus Scybalousia scybalohippi]